MSRNIGVYLKRETQRQPFCFGVRLLRASTGWHNEVFSIHKLPLRANDKLKFVINLNFTGLDKGGIVGANLLVESGPGGPPVSGTEKLACEPLLSLALQRERGNSYLQLIVLQVLETLEGFQKHPLSNASDLYYQQ